jgi:hypothetical protein
VAAGRDCNYFRDYDPQTGRALESDPIGLNGGVGTNAYVRSDPVSRRNVTGLVDVGPIRAGHRTFLMSRLSLLTACGNSFVACLAIWFTMVHSTGLGIEPIREFRFAMAQTALNSATSTLTDARVLREFLNTGVKTRIIGMPSFLPL